MDLRRIVDEVENRKRYELSLVGPPEARSRPAPGSGAVGSLLHSVRARMLAENPGADVTHINSVIEPDTATAPAPAPVVRARQTSPAVTVTATAPLHRAVPAAKDDFLDRYLELSAEFEQRYGIPGWADFVAKKTKVPAKAEAPPPSKAAPQKRAARKPARRRA